MRVLHVWDNYAPGLFDHSLAICREEGVEASLVAMNWIDRGSAEEPAFPHVRQLSGDRKNLGVFGRIAGKLRRFMDTHRFRSLVRREVERFRPDVLHVHYGTTGAILANDLLTSPPFVISFYGFDISQGVRTASIRRLYRRMMHLQPLVHVLCDEARDRAIALGAEPDRVILANLPLPIARYPDIGLTAPRVSRWLIPARFVAKKGHEVLLQAFRLYLAAHPEDWLTCWGYGDRKWLQRRVDELGLSEKVSVIDNAGETDFDRAYVSELERHDAVLAPSVRSSRGDDEGGPALTLVLAQVAGKPVIVSDFPGSERSVTDGVEGFVVAQGNSEALCDAMRNLAANPDRARRMGEAGRCRSMREFNRETYRNALLSWYRALAQ